MAPGWQPKLGMADYIGDIAPVVMNTLGQVYAAQQGAKQEDTANPLADMLKNNFTPPQPIDTQLTPSIGGNVNGGRQEIGPFSGLPMPTVDAGPFSTRPINPAIPLGGPGYRPFQPFTFTAPRLG